MSNNSRNYTGFGTLDNYNNVGPKGISTTLMQQKQQGHMVVPSYASIGYNTLVNLDNKQGHTGFFNITDAYGSRAGTCKQDYLPKTCGN